MLHAAVVFAFILLVFTEWITFAKDAAQFFVILAAFHAVQQGFGGFGCIQIAESLAHLPHHSQFFFGQQ